MGTRLTHLQCKEVICVSDGRRLGFIEDLEVTVPEGTICAIIVPEAGKFPGLPGKRHDFCIPWSCIRKIGPDIVLVDVKPDDCRVLRSRQGIPLRPFP